MCARIHRRHVCLFGLSLAVPLKKPYKSGRFAAGQSGELHAAAAPFRISVFREHLSVNFFKNPFSWSAYGLSPMPFQPRQLSPRPNQCNDFRFSPKIQKKETAWLFLKIEAVSTYFNACLKQLVPHDMQAARIPIPNRRIRSSYYLFYLFM